MSIDRPAVLNSALPPPYSRRAAGDGMQQQQPPPPSQEVHRVLVLLNMLTSEALDDDQEHGEILDDVALECEEFGEVVEVFIPRPSEGDLHGVGKIFVEFAQEASASAAGGGLGGREFDGRTILAAFLDPQKWDQGLLDNHTAPL
mmetsp:Transcript_45369/g.84246  ORF Transcript_45369/g.84246 Transcript_45369/m.84246 type:complete len:145 (+) Transcript_45369:349-783(+)